MPDRDDQLITLAEIAQRLGWTLNTARTMQRRANRRRAAGKPRPGDLPEPDHFFGRTPVWRLSTITQWQAARPGQGAGGGRPTPKPKPKPKD